MTNPLPLTNDDGEVRELTREDFVRMKPARDVLPMILGADLAAELLAERVPDHETKIATTVRLDADVILAFRASGKGWQARMNDILRDWLQSHSPA